MDLDDLDAERLKLRLSIKWQHYGPDCLPAWVAEMDFPIAEPIRAVLERALEHHDFGYPQECNSIGLPELFAERMQKRYEWQLEPGRVEILNDVVQGLYVALLAYTQPGEGVLVQTPVYPPFLHSVRETGRRLLASPLRDNGERYEADPAELRAVAPQARVLLLCNPQNPTGRVFSRAELTELAELALERDWIVVSDEIHADLTFPGSEFVPFASLGPEVAARTVTLTSATKAFNIAGLRCAIAHFGTPLLQQRFNAAVLPHVRGGVGILGQYCTKAAWQSGEPWLSAVKHRLDENRRWLVGELQRSLPGVRVHAPEATYLAWLDLRQLGLRGSPTAFFRDHARVALSDGAWFGEGFEAYARFNFATSKAILAQIVERMAAALAGAQG
jgi:cysteine-S-conjugate beta-lyase